MLAFFVSSFYLMYFVFIFYVYLYNVLHFILNKSIHPSTLQLKCEGAFNDRAVQTYTDPLCNAQSPQLPQKEQTLSFIFVMPGVFASHMRSHEIAAPRNLKDSTYLTSMPCNKKRQMGVFFQRKSTFLCLPLRSSM